jgi:putative transposase
MIMMTRRRHPPEQVVRKLQSADQMLAKGKDFAAVGGELQVAEPTYHRWRNESGGLKADDAKRLKERENATLKRLLADAELGGRRRGRSPRSFRRTCTAPISRSRMAPEAPSPSKSH